MNKKPSIPHYNVLSQSNSRRVLESSQENGFKRMATAEVPKAVSKA
jgi:hypothetical protein